MSWSLDQAYDEFPRIEAEFSAALDQSMNPRSPDVLYDLVAELNLPAHAASLDVGCGEGVHSLVLARRLGLSVMGIDPVARHVAAARAAARGGERVVFVRGAAEEITPRGCCVARMSCAAVRPERQHMMLGDSLWHLYGMIGKLTRRAYLFSRPVTG